MCLKGFQEPIDDGEESASPTAGRLSHRLVCHTAAQKKLPIASMDVSVAFLKGFTFKELADKGINRKACAFKPPQVLGKSFSS